ncbi:28S ribosomal protein S15, mitochondrial-like [Patiria miniata]|uniref:Small ribosomal subunit protein uS15m n=1 Tax=Patiria miniata TaxID=46514 RepID=A0A914A571_PATMI|nr:28S ribosomal protein S15, mitochondrial-like [Patiria miniata]
MFGRVTALGCASEICRQICRKVTTRIVVDIASRATMMNAVQLVQTMKTCTNVTNHCWQNNSEASGLLLLRNHPPLCQVNVSRQFASKATSKFARRVKKETFDRYLGLDPSRLQHGFEEVTELQDADESVKRIFSLEFAKGSEIRKVLEADTLGQVGVDQAEIGFTNFLVTNIAKLTAAIRNLAPHMERFPRDKSNKRQLMMMIDRRRKFIKILLRRNFDLANELLDKLNLEYTPPPRYNRRVTRRALEKKTLVQQAIQERRIAMWEFTGKLKEEQLREIAKLKKELGMELTEDEMGRLGQDGM